ATLETLKASSPDAASYPQSTTELVWSGRRYVYFHAPGMEQASFICDMDMGAQFGREAVYRAISSALNMPDMHDYSEQGLGWRWQDFPRYEHMLTTMNELTEPLYQLSADAEALAYGFISHLGAIGIPGVADLHDQQPGQDAALGA